MSGAVDVANFVHLSTTGPAPQHVGLYPTVPGLHNFLVSTSSPIPPQPPNPYLHPPPHTRSKYANMWRVLGAEPYMIRVNTWDVIPPFHGRAEHDLTLQAEQIGQAYAVHSGAQPGPGQPPVFVHTFSNAGYLVYGGMIARLAWAGGYPVTHVTQPRDRFTRRQLLGLHDFQRIMGPTRGIIVDSAPSRMSADVWTRWVLLGEARQRQAGDGLRRTPWQSLSRGGQRRTRRAPQTERSPRLRVHRGCAHPKPLSPAPAGAWRRRCAEPR